MLSPPAGGDVVFRATSSHSSPPDDPVMVALQKLLAAQRKVESNLLLLRQEQMQVSFDVKDVQKDVISLAASLRGGFAAGAGRNPPPRAANAYAAMANWPSDTSRQAPSDSTVCIHVSPPEPANNSSDAFGGHGVDAFSPLSSDFVDERGGASGRSSERRRDSSPVADGVPDALSEAGDRFVAPTLPLSWPTVICAREDFLAFPPPERLSLMRGASTISTPIPSAAIQERERRRTNAVAILGTGSGATSRTSWTFFSSWREEDRSQGVLCNFVIRPNSVLRAALDLLSCLVLLYDLTANPIILAWELPLAGRLFALALTSCTFWTLEMCANTITGFERGSRTELHAKEVSLHYLRTWCIFDFLMTSADWLCLWLLRLGHAGFISATVLLMLPKLGRVFRLVRKWPSMKFVRVAEDLTEGLLSELQRTCLRMLMMLCGTLWLNHLMCCAWIAVGRSAHTDTGMRWVDGVNGGVSLDFLEANFGYQYSTAFHWSMAQLVSGEIEISCANTAERMFNILCLLVGLLFSSTLVSSLSASMVEMQMRMRESRTKLMRLRRYLRENKVNRITALRVQQQAVDRLGRKQKLIEKDVQVIQLLSSTLKGALRFEICRPYMIKHPLFRLWIGMDMGMVKRVCTEAAEISYLRPQDDLFTAGSSTDKAYYIISGGVMYIQDPESAPVKEVERMEVGAESWLAEASLWSHWTHVGTAEAIITTQVMHLSAEGLARTLRRHQGIHEIALEYCKHFHRRIVSAKPPDAPWPTDLMVPFTDFGDLVTSMDKDVQVTIGLSALDQVQQQMSGWAWLPRLPTGIEKLREEVEKGKSVVMMNGNNELERVVSVVALRAEDDDGRVFAQLGKLTAEGAPEEVACQLPGGKQQQGELTTEALQRILQAKLEPLADKVEILGTERLVEWNMSRGVGLKTKYLRTVCSARLQTPFPLNVIPVQAIKAGPPYLQAASATQDLSGIRSPLATRTAYAVAERDHENLYAWLRPDELEHLSSPAGEADLSWWLGELSNNAESIAAHRARHLPL